jgi:mono/diheme cytochrome c family protein
MRNAPIAAVVTIFAALFATNAVSADTKSPARPFNIGEPASRQDIQALNLSVLPSGEGLPEGSGTVNRGKEIYAAQCASCHGDKGEGKPEFPALVGGRDTLSTSAPLLTVGSYWPYATSVFDYVRRAMPYATPGSLSNDDVYAVTAWLLNANEIIQDDVLLNRETLPLVRMPNREGFIRDPRPDVKAVR